MDGAELRREGAGSRRSAGKNEALGADWKGRGAHGINARRRIRVQQRCGSVCAGALQRDASRLQCSAPPCSPLLGALRGVQVGSQLLQLPNILGPQACPLQSAQQGAKLLC